MARTRNLGNIEDKHPCSVIMRYVFLNHVMIFKDSGKPKVMNRPWAFSMFLGYELLRII